MTKTLQLFIIAFVLQLTGCYLGISGRVIDAETQQPIEGAIVLAQWTKTHGLGLTYHSVYKIVETETDKNGNFLISGAYSPFVNAPTLVVYKQGYVAWRNDFVFPDYVKRTDYNLWQNNYEYRLERFKKAYVMEKHHLFFGRGIMIDGLTRVPKFHKALNDE